VAFALAPRKTIGRFDPSWAKHGGCLKNSMKEFSFTVPPLHYKET